MALLLVLGVEPVDLSRFDNWREERCCSKGFLPGVSCCSIGLVVSVCASSG